MKILLVTILFCLSLIGCSSNQVVRTEYIRPDIPPIPEEPEYYNVQWQKINKSYCLDADNAINLLKNIEFMKGYQLELKTMLEELK